VSGKKEVGVARPPLTTTTTATIIIITTTTTTIIITIIIIIIIAYLTTPQEGLFRGNETNNPDERDSFNPLSPDMKRHILFIVLHGFLMELVRRI